MSKYNFFIILLMFFIIIISKTSLESHKSNFSTRVKSWGKLLTQDKQFCLTVFNLIVQSSSFVGFYFILFVFSLVFNLDFQVSPACLFFFLPQYCELSAGLFLSLLFAQPVPSSRRYPNVNVTPEINIFRYQSCIIQSLRIDDYVHLGAGAFLYRRWHSHPFRRSCQ